jgi:hypothetical protein
VDQGDVASRAIRPPRVWGADPVGSREGARPIGAEGEIPSGPYCYASLDPMDERGHMKVNGKCPYWQSRGEMNAYCAFLDEEDTLLLWDQVKICGVNDAHDPLPDAKRIEDQVPL